MADTKGKTATVKKTPVARKKNVKGTVGTKKSTKNVTKKAVKSKKVKDDTSFILEATENIEAGAKVVGEKASDIAGKLADISSQLAEEIYDKIKKGVSEAYDTGSKAVDELGKTTQEYIARFENTMEMRKLRDKRNRIVNDLGSSLFMTYKSRRVLPEELLKITNIESLFKELKKLDKSIVELGKKLEKKKK
jgi:hypothetical protein